MPFFSSSSAMSFLPLLLLLLLAPAARPDFAKDRDECASTLAGLATCLPYVQGSSSAPTPDCCTGLKSLLATSAKCLCVLIKDRNDPGLGIQINLTRALTLPNSCSASSNISHCPELLNLPPNSPDAQIFKNLTAAGTGNSMSGRGRGTSNENSTSDATWLYNYHLAGGRWWVGVEQAFVGLLFLAFVAG